MRHKLKGFTLVEMIIVLAIFSGIMLSIVNLLDPVSKFMVRSSNFENTTACIDNMKRSIEGNLKFADRVRAYSGYAPYQYYDDTTGGLTVKKTDYSPTVDLTKNLKTFYTEFFEDRKCLDTSGSIYVLCFDNTTLVDETSMHTASSPLQRVSDYTQNQLNSGKMVLYEFQFDNYDDTLDSFEEVFQIETASSLSGGTIEYAKPDADQITTWYVNQKLYGNFDYRFTLGAFNEPAATTTAWTTTTATTTTTAATTSGEETGTTLPTTEKVYFNPSDCTISISMCEIKKDNANGGLFRDDVTRSSICTFSMKNVMDTGKLDGSALDDYVLRCHDETVQPHVYTSTNIPRYRAVDINTTAEFDGFYFIFTIPQNIHDAPNAEDLVVNQTLPTTAAP